MITEEKISFGLIVCTYERASSLKRLLDSVKKQTQYPDEILIIDGSFTEETKDIIDENPYVNLKYFKVGVEDRGLTKQRNYGIDHSGNVDVICFADDDLVLEKDYFAQLLSTYKKKPEAIAVGGWIDDDTYWRKVEGNYKPKFDEFIIDNYVRKLGQRNVFRKRLGLLSDKPPGFMPEFSHGFSTGFLPPLDKTYEVEFFMGGVSSYRSNLFQKIKFSSYFEGYGLYEDMDFCLRASKIGQLYVNCAARVVHHHEQAGRPNKYKFGKMVIINGWYVWRVKYPHPSLKARFKWHATAYLLTLVRFGNVISTSKRKEALTESFGRIAGWFTLIFKNLTSE
ncbi:glycosyltransferase family 2 protein [Gramella sp. KN1008]|uniref:glycosyltransferase family 2 protein n=1 Tax=Gramella sp. KN1008 TaxID=2529298 RepID=UPI00103AA7EC|nr:glycosyltransferase [Gramella sp. KN1008]TBW25663.1 glycosyltransferase [Gramella sp. KN1008]